VKHPRPKRARKPHPYSPDNTSYVDVYNAEYGRISASAYHPYASDQRRILLHPKEARRLAAWLIRFADWAEARKSFTETAKRRQYESTGHGKRG
jgi:hypothetical protein